MTQTLWSLSEKVASMFKGPSNMDEIKEPLPNTAPRRGSYLEYNMEGLDVDEKSVAEKPKEAIKENEQPNKKDVFVNSFPILATPTS